MKEKKGKKQSGFVNWWKELCRTHGADEYREFYMRGWDTARLDQPNRTYPWMYTRVLGVTFLLFALMAFITALTGERMQYLGYPTVVTLGGLLLGLPVLVFIYELYPRRDFSLAKLCLCMTICTAVTDVAVNLGYFALQPANPWVSGIWTVVLEETAKAIPALVAIVLMRKRTPMGALVIAAACGVGMGLSEDLGYIFIASSQEGVDMSNLVIMTLVRALPSIGGHMIWTGLIGWAFGKLRRPLLDVRFWLMCLASMGIHYLWNIPLESGAGLATAAAFGIGLLSFEYIVRKERRRVFAEMSDAQVETAESDESVVARKYSAVGIATVAVAILIGIGGIVFCCLY